MNDEILNIEQLPDLLQFTRTTQALAIVDAILMPDWEGRYFSFNSRWNQELSHQMASMRNGSGDEYFVLISPLGVVGKVYAPGEPGYSAANATDLPAGLSTGFVDEPAFALDRTTFIFWRASSASTWSVSPGSLRAFPHLGFIAYGARYYHEWAQRYYERVIDLSAVEDIFQTLRVDEHVVRRLNPDQSIEGLADDLAEIL